VADALATRIGGSSTSQALTRTSPRIEACDVFVHVTQRMKRKKVI